MQHQIPKRHWRGLLALIVENERAMICDPSTLPLRNLSHPQVQQLNLPEPKLVLEYLRENGFVSVEKRAPDGNIHSFQTTDRGFCYFENRSEEVWQFIRRSILVPIAVSLATTILFWCVKRWITGSWV